MYSSKEDFLRDLELDQDFRKALDQWVEDEARKDQIRILQETGLGSFNEFVTDEDSFSDMVKLLDLETNPRPLGREDFLLDLNEDLDSEDEECKKHLKQANRLFKPSKSPRKSATRTMGEDMLQDESEEEELPFYLRQPCAISDKKLKDIYTTLKAVDKSIKKKCSTKAKEIIQRKEIIIPEKKINSPKIKTRETNPTKAASRILRNELIMED